MKLALGINKSIQINPELQSQEKQQQQQKTQVIKNIITHKNDGSSISFVVGQLFIMIIIIYALFNFRLEALNTVFNYIDDSLTTSLLGGALVNYEEYGQSHQIVIYGNDEYDNVGSSTSNTKGWTQAEADILLSEINYGSDVLSGYDALPYKKDLSLNNRYGVGSNSWKTDTYLKRSLSSFVNNLKYNITSGKVDDKTITNNVDTLGSKFINGKLYISATELRKTLLGDYIVNHLNGTDNIGIEITRFDIYNLYRSNLAEKHIYKSQFFTVNSDERTVTWKTINGVTVSNLANFERAYENEKDSPGYAALKHRYEVDYKVASSGNPLVCYTDANTTYQGKYSSSKEVYKYFYSSSGRRWQNSLGTLTSADLVTPGKEAPIVGYSVYSFKSNGNDTTSASFNYTDLNGSSSSLARADYVELETGKLKGAKLTGTSLYAELTFDIRIMSEFWDRIATNIKPTDTVKPERITVARLVDIEIK